MKIYLFIVATLLLSGCAMHSSVSKLELDRESYLSNDSGRLFITLDNPNSFKESVEFHAQFIPQSCGLIIYSNNDTVHELSIHKNVNHYFVDFNLNPGKQCNVNAQVCVAINNDKINYVNCIPIVINSTQ